MADTELHLRKAIIAKCRWMNDSGLNQGTSGNISARLLPEAGRDGDGYGSDLSTRHPNCLVTWRHAGSWDS